MHTAVEQGNALSAAPGESVLLVAPAEHFASIKPDLERAGYQVVRTESQEEASTLLRDQEFDLIVLYEPGRGTRALERLRLLRERGKGEIFVLALADADIETTLLALRNGAAEVIPPQLTGDELLLAFKKARERMRATADLSPVKKQAQKRYSFDNIIAKSSAMIEIFETIKKICDYKTTVLLFGESGTGKELIARAIHHNSVRRNRRFVALNCGAIPENLLESELFGHKRGAFTDATRDKKGLFEEADGGTLLLDEIGELPMHLQVKLLRVLQESEIRPVGDAVSISIDVRVVAATLRDLEDDILQGRFRDDLYYRLNVVSLRIPPLRERKDDIPVLIDFFIRKNRERLGLPVYGIANTAAAILMDHDWPGNIRELENCIERAMILTESDEITVESLPRSVKPSTAGSAPAPAPGDELSIKVHSRVLEESLIRRALEQTGGNRTHAAKLLEISHRTLLYKLKEYNLTDK